MRVFTLDSDCRHGDLLVKAPFAAAYGIQPKAPILLLHKILMGVAEYYDLHIA